MTTKLTEKQVQHWFEHERAKRGKRGKAASVSNAPVERLSKEAVDKLMKWYDEHEFHSCPLMEDQNKVVDERYPARIPHANHIYQRKRSGN